MEGDALLPLHGVRRDERGRDFRRAARSHRSFGRGPKLLRTMALGKKARGAFSLAKSTPLAAARQFTPQKSAFTEKEFRALRSAAKGAAFGIRSL